MKSSKRSQWIALASLLSATSVAAVTPGMAYASVQSRYTVSGLKIVVNGRTTGTAHALHYQGMPYISIWYIMQTLEHFSVLSRWNGTNLQLTLSPQQPVDLTSISVGTGSQSVTINGTTVARTTGISYKINGTTSASEYIPLSVLEPVLARLGIQVTWTGTTLTLTPNSPLFTATAKSGSALGTFETEDKAKAALQKSPGGTIKNSQNKVIYTAPDYAAFISPAASPKEFTTLSDADHAIQRNDLGYVVNLQTHEVVTYPQNYYYLDNGGNWVSSLYGQMGTSKPSFAKPNAIYVALDSLTGHSPYLSHFYELSASGDHYLGTFSGDYENPFRTIDLRDPAPSSITRGVLDKWFTDNNSPLQGLGSSYIEAQNTYGVNAVYLVGHSIIESAWGRSSIAQSKNNLFGYGAYNSAPGRDAGMFPSEEYAILFQAWEVRNNYLDPGASLFFNAPTLDGMNQNYATSHDWSSAVAAKMDELVHQVGGATSDYAQYSPSNSVAAPTSTQEPVFWMNGATAAVKTNPYYPGVPVFSDWATGNSEQFSRVLQNGDFGSDVVTMQKALNANGQNIATDGDFGPMTEKALKSYQTSHGIQPTGVCDFATWESLNAAPIFTFLNPNSPVQVIQIEQGMQGGLVVPWYHVVQGNLSGWVDANDLQLNNVYRIYSTSGYKVNIYSDDLHTVIETLHSGDFVVINNPNPIDGLIKVQVSSQSDGTPIVGYVPSYQVSVTQQQ